MTYLWFCRWGFIGFTFRCGNTSWFCHSCGNASCFGCSCPLWASWWNGLFLRRDLNFLFTPVFFPLLILFILLSFHLSQFGAGLHRTCFRGWFLFGFGVKSNRLRAALGRGDRVHPSLRNKKNYVTNTWLLHDLCRRLISWKKGFWILIRWKLDKILWMTTWMFKLEWDRVKTNYRHVCCSVRTNLFR